MKKALIIAIVALAACGKEQIELRAYDGKNGKDGQDGASTAGPTGPAGIPGTPGTPGEDGSFLQDGLLAQVHNLPNWNSVTLPELFVGNPTIGEFVLNDVSVGDTQSSGGFPGMPANLQALVGTDGYSLDINGYINVPTTGFYVFKFFTDDGVVLLINDVTIISDDSLHAPRTATSSSIRLNAGLNRINIIYYQGPHTQIALQLKWSGPNLPEQVIPSTSYSH